MIPIIHRLIFPLFYSVLLFTLLWILSERATRELANPAIITGWFLFGVILFLGAFNVRKKLAAFNVGPARAWLALHIVGGLLAVCIFLFHTGTLWPTGVYERILATLFWIVTATGFFGVAVIVIYPRRLTDSGLEIIYEHIPSEIYSIRERAEAEVVACTEKSGESTLADHHVDTMDWYFRRPRFYFNHLVGGIGAEAWIRSHGNAVRRYLSPEETPFLDRLLALAEQKTAIDRQYACQDVMRKWLVAHVPFSVALIGISVWHLVLVYVYAK
jgi:hypothetical protein